MSYYGVFIPSKTNFEGSVEQCSGSVAATNYSPSDVSATPPSPSDAISGASVVTTKQEDPEYPVDSPLWLVFQEKSKALNVLRQYKDARLREFSDLEQAERYVQFGFESVQSLKLCGKIRKNSASTTPQNVFSSASMHVYSGSNISIVENNIPSSTTVISNSNCSSNLNTTTSTIPNNNTNSNIANQQNNIISLHSERPAFRAPTKQELVEFRKAIESGDYVRVNRYIWENPRYLISSGDTPTNLKEGYRYNALHISAQFNQPDIAELILHVVANNQFSMLYTGKRANEKMCAVLNENLLDYYLNIPDKGRSETPLHFAVKNGHVKVVAVLTSYPQCKSIRNKEGQYPMDIICQRVRNPDPEIHKQIELLLSERFYVPVLRAPDITLPPKIGQPFSTINLSKFLNNLDNCNKDNNAYKVKAFAGPMNKEEAQNFHRRWKTPPRNASQIMSPIVKGQYISPMKSPNASNINLSSKPIGVLPVQLFSPIIDSQPDKDDILQVEQKDLMFINDNSFADKQNGNEKKSDYLAKDSNIYAISAGKDTATASEMDAVTGTVTEIESDDETNTYEANNNSTNNNNQNRNQEPSTLSSQQYYEKYGSLSFPITPLKRHNHDIFNIYRSAELSPFVSELVVSSSPIQHHAFPSTTMFNDSMPILTNDSYKERHIKNTDFEKGLEVIGRSLAKQDNVGWNEYWDFLDMFIDISSPIGLEKLEQFFCERAKQRNTTLNKVDDKQVIEKQFEFNEVCTALALCGLTKDYNIKSEFDHNHINGVNACRPGAVLYTDNAAAMPPVNTPYTYVEKSLQVFAKRMTKTIINNMNNVAAINDTLFSELKRLKSLISSFKQDTRFCSVDFSKVHARMGDLIAIYVVNSQDAKLATKVKIQSILLDLWFINGSTERREHLECVCSHIQRMLEESTYILPDTLKTEELCSEAWTNGNSCECQWEVNLSRKTSRRKRTEFLYEKQKQKQQQKQEDIQTFPTSEEINTASENIISIKDLNTDIDDSDSDMETFWDCYAEDDSDVNSDEKNEYFLTPPEFATPVQELTPEPQEAESAYKIFIFGDKPTKRDVDVLNAILHVDLDTQKYPRICAWKDAITRYTNKEMDLFSSPTFINKIHKSRVAINSPFVPRKYTDNEAGLASPNVKKICAKTTCKGRLIFGTPKLTEVTNAHLCNETSYETTAVKHPVFPSLSTVNTNTPRSKVNPLLKMPLQRVCGLFNIYRETIEKDDDFNSSDDSPDNLSDNSSLKNEDK